jgi:hypothetical protein
MIRFNWRDFNTAAAALAAGMVAVIGFAFWRSGGNVKIVAITAGLPLGVLAFWGIYTMKMKFADRPRPSEISPRFKRNATFVSFHRPEEAATRPTLPLRSHANHDIARLRILQGRQPTISTQDAESMDQWHQA